MIECCCCCCCSHAQGKPSHALQDVESRLAAAFKPLGNRAVDVFAMAEALSQRESSGSTGSGSGMLDDIVEFVPKVCNCNACAP